MNRTMNRTPNRTPNRKLSSLAVLSAFGLSLATAGAARAVPIDDARPEASVADVLKSGDPLALADLLQEMSGRAERATKKGDHAAAARYWLALTKAVPERTYGFARLCDALDANGQRDQALVACRTAITKDGTTAGDYTHFVKLLLASDAPLTASDRRQIDVAIGQLAKEPAAALITERVRCNVAAHEHDGPGLEACTAKLVSLAPDDARTIAFQWTLAVDKGDKAGAELHFARAAAAGTDKEALARMAAKMRAAGWLSHRGTTLSRFVAWGVAGLLVTLAVFAIWAAGARTLASFRRRTAV
jgi:hypothetical protein